MLWVVKMTNKYRIPYPTQMTGLMAPLSLFLEKIKNSAATGAIQSRAKRAKYPNVRAPFISSIV